MLEYNGLKGFYAERLDKPLKMTFDEQMERIVQWRQQSRIQVSDAFVSLYAAITVASPHNMTLEQYISSLNQFRSQSRGGNMGIETKNGIMASVLGLEVGPKCFRRATPKPHTTLHTHGAFCNIAARTGGCGQSGRARRYGFERCD